MFPQKGNAEHPGMHFSAFAPLPGTGRFRFLHCCGIVRDIMFDKNKAPGDRSIRVGS